MLRDSGRVAHLVSRDGGACPAPLILSCPALQLDIGPILVLGEEANRRLSPLIEYHDMCAYSQYLLMCHSLGEHALQVNGP